MAAEKEYRAKLDFHHDGKHYPVGKSYVGKDAERLMKSGLLEEGKGHNNPCKHFMPMRLKPAELAVKGV